MTLLTFLSALWRQNQPNTIHVWNSSWSFSCTRLYTILHCRNSVVAEVRRHLQSADARTCVVPQTRIQFGDRSFAVLVRGSGTVYRLHCMTLSASESSWRHICVEAAATHSDCVCLHVTNTLTYLQHRYLPAHNHITAIYSTQLLNVPTCDTRPNDQRQWDLLWKIFELRHFSSFPLLQESNLLTSSLQCSTLLGKERRRTSAVTQMTFYLLTLWHLTTVYTVAVHKWTALYTDVLFTYLRCDIHGLYEHLQW